MKFSTINQIVESLLSEAEGENPSLTRNQAKMLANEATIYLKTAAICEQKGIDAAMGYYRGTHHENEYQLYRAGVVGAAE